MYFTRRQSANDSPSKNIESSSRKDLFTVEEESNHCWALAIFEMSPYRVLDHLGEFGPGVALSSNPVPQGRCLVATLGRFQNLKNNRVHEVTLQRLPTVAKSLKRTFDENVSNLRLTFPVLRTL